MEQRLAWRTGTFRLARLHVFSSAWLPRRSAGFLRSASPRPGGYEARREAAMFAKSWRRARLSGSS
jgi:hypothetical protein